MIHYRETQFGFEYGAAMVNRLFSDEKRGWVTFTIDTQKHHGHEALQVYVTKTGKVRIHGADGEWTPPPKQSPPRMRVVDTKTRRA